MSDGRRRFLGWLVAAAGAVLVAGGFEVARSSGFRRPELRSEDARSSSHIPQDIMVIVAEDGKTFHIGGCQFIHDGSELRTIPAREAEKEGYTPCVRCMNKYLDVHAAA